MPLISEHLTVVYLQVHRGGPHFVLNALKCWVEPFHIITDRKLLGMRRAMCSVDCVIVSQIPDPEV